jgi:hypothetical protein
LKRIEQKKTVRGRMLSVWMNRGQKKAYIYHSSTLKFDMRVDQLGLKKNCLTLEKCETDAWVKSDRGNTFDAIKQKNKK